MNLLKKLTVLTIMSLMITNVSWAKKGPRDGGFRKILKELNLTQEQKDKLKTMRKANKVDHKKVRAEMKANREKMKAAFTSDASADELKKLHETIKKFKMDKMDQRFNKMLEIRSVLTKEQRVKFQELQEKNQSNRRSKRKKQ